MPIKIVREGDLYAAEVTPPQGTWRSPRPMPNDELGRKLLSIGCDPVDIRRALVEAGVQPFTHEYRVAAERTRPLLLAALAGEREVPPQRPFTEAWLADALFYYSRALPLEEVLESADAINHAVPNPEEVAWAFLCLRRRGWLAVDGELFGLTPEGRRAVQRIVTQGEASWRVGRLEEWISAHPLPGDDRRSSARAKD